MSDERPDSLAAQAASWVPPWEREQPPLDRDYQAAAQDDSDDSDGFGEPETADGPVAHSGLSDEPDSIGQPDEDDKITEAGLGEDDDDFDEAFEGPNPPGYQPVDQAEAAAAASSSSRSAVAGGAAASSLSAAEGGAAASSSSLSAVAGGAAASSLSAAEGDAAASSSSLSAVAGGAAASSPSAAEGDAAASSSSLSAVAGDATADGEVGDNDETGGVPAELPPLPGESAEPATVDSPTELEGDSTSPIDVGVGPDIDVPASIEEAGEDADDDEAGDPVDAPLPPDGDDAGDVFDAAADDDVSDDDEVDLPFEEEVPGEDDEPSSPAPDDAASDGAAGDGAAGDDAPAGGTSEAALTGGAPDPVQADGASGGASAGAGGEVASPDPGGAVATAVAGGVGAIPGQGRRPRAKVGAAEARTPEVESFEAPPIDDTELRAALEAILLVVDEPVAEMQLAQIMEQPTERVARMLDDISARYTAAGHGFDLRRAAGGWRLYTRPEYAAYVERFVLDGQSVRLTQAALETLAVVAYKQPVTRSRISAIRGVNVDGVMRTLATRGLIEECGTEGETGAYLYRTTGLFLEKLGLNSVDQLPPLAPFLPDDVEEVLDASG